MQLKYRLNLISLNILLGVAVVLTALGILAIDTLSLQLHEKLLTLLLESRMEKIRRAHDVLVKSGVHTIQAYLQRAQASQIEEIRKFRYGKTGQFLVIAEPDRVVWDDRGEEKAQTDLPQVNSLFAVPMGQRWVSYRNQKYWIFHARFEPWKWLVILRVAAEEVNEIRNHFLRQAILILLLSVLIGSWFIVRFAGRIADSISTLAKASLAISQGDWKVTIPNQIDKDEIGTLTRSFRQMADALRTQTQEISQSVELLQRTVETIVTASGAIATAAHQSATSVAETKAVTMMLRDAAAHQRDHAKVIAKETSEAADMSEEGRRALQLIAEGGENIRNRMDVLVESILQLSEQAEHIYEILNTVEDLADQSQLLAVNAAMEAVKAGEWGKGFGVVAAEIRSLANRSKESIGRIRSILQETQNALRRSVEASEHATHAAKESREQCRASTSLLQGILQHVVTSAELAQTIEKGSQEQATGIDQVAASMSQLHEGAQRAATATEELRRTAADLDTLAKRLHERVQHYQF